VRFLAAIWGPQNIPRQCHFGGSDQDPLGAGVGGFRKMLARVAQVAPLRRNVTTEDVGKAATFLCSDLASGVTGEILYVDNGFSHVGMSFPRTGLRSNEPASAAAGDRYWNTLGLVCTFGVLLQIPARKLPAELRDRAAHTH